MKSWTRTLNLDDAHSLLALASPGIRRSAWAEACHEALPELSVERRRELIRLLRDGFLEWGSDGQLLDGLFLHMYERAPASAQVDLVDVQWAISHPLTLLAAESLVAPALNGTQGDIPLEAVEALVAQHLDTSSEESRRKTRTVLLGALEGLGAVATRGTGQHRTIRAARGTPHPVSFAYLLQRELRERGIDGMMTAEVLESSLPVRLTQCTPEHAQRCVTWCVQRGLLVERGDEIGLP